MSDIKVLRRAKAESLVLADFNWPLMDVYKWMNTIPIFKPLLSKLNVQYSLVPQITQSGFTTQLGTSVNTPNACDLFLSLLNSKPSALLKFAMFAVHAYTAVPKKTLITGVSDEEYVDLHLKAFPFLDVEIIKNSNEVIENLSYSFMDESNYKDNSNPGDFMVHYRITNSKRLVLHKIVEIIEGSRKVTTRSRSSVEWEDAKYRSLVKMMLNQWLYYHTFIHKQNAEIFNQFNKSGQNGIQNPDIIAFINAFSEDSIITNTFVTNLFIGNLTNNQNSDKDDYLYHLHLDRLKKIDICNENNMTLNLLIRGYYSYNIIMRYKIVIRKFVQGYLDKCDSCNCDMDFILPYLSKNSLISSSVSVSTKVDLLALYVFNVVMHSIIHVQTSIVLNLFGHMALVNTENTNFIPLIHDTFAYNLDFWLDENKFGHTIKSFRNDLVKTDAYVRRCKLHDLFGIQNICSAINE